MYKEVRFLALENYRPCSPTGSSKVVCALGSFSFVQNPSMRYNACGIPVIVTTETCPSPNSKNTTQEAVTSHLKSTGSILFPVSLPQLRRVFHNFATSSDLSFYSYHLKHTLFTFSAFLFPSQISPSSTPVFTFARNDICEQTFSDTHSSISSARNIDDIFISQFNMNLVGRISVKIIKGNSVHENFINIKS